MKLSILLAGSAVVLGLSGCSANLIATRGTSKSLYAPVNEKDLSGGILKLDCGESDVQWILDECLKHGEADIKAYCQGPYRITKRAARLDGQTEADEKVVAKIGHLDIMQTVPGLDRIRYLFFDCRTDTKS